MTVRHGLETEHAAIENEMVNVVCGIINGNVHHVSALCDSLEIIHPLVLNPHQVLATLLRRSQAEVAAGVRFSVCHFVHAAGEREQHNIIARGRLITGSVGHGAGDLRGKEACREDEAEER